MQEKEYFKEIQNVIENIEVNSRVRKLQDNSEKLKAYWEIGKLIVEAQGGKERAKYGEQLMKKWSVAFSLKYGNGYDYTNLSRMRLLYFSYPNIGALSQYLNWTHFRYLLPIKNVNERNYYTNLVITNHLSSRELICEIKNKSFDRLSYIDKENIKLIEEENFQLSIEDMIKDPILLKTNKSISKFDEKIIHKYIIELLENKFLELGTGFALIGHEYKICIENKTYKIDLLFFNYELNSFIVVEVKTRELQPRDIGQLEFYVNYIDKNIKKINHNQTIGILVVKKKNHYVIEYTTINNMYFTTYELI